MSSVKSNIKKDKKIEAAIAKQFQEWKHLKETVAGAAWSLPAFVKQLERIRLTKNQLASLLLEEIHEVHRQSIDTAVQLARVTEQAKKAEGELLVVKKDLSVWKTAAVGVMEAVVNSKLSDLESKKEDTRIPNRCLPFNIHDCRNS